MTRHPALLAAALLGGLALAVPPARAQGLPIQNQLPKTTARPNEPLQAPAALPGAVRSPGEAPQPGASTAGMKPNDALFDAVNRGDIASVREALSRGADVDARNVLGLTAAELSVDLGRNDITFLLLSMRGSGSAGRSAAPPAGKAAASAPRVAATRVATGVPAAHAAPARPAPPAAATPGRDPGIPAPQAGFLGFGPSR